jgi:hypothetical protein
MKNKFTLIALALLGLRVGDVSAQCAANETAITINLTTDQYGTETTWTLTSITGTPSFGSGGPYGPNLGAVGTTVQTINPVCVANGTAVRFTINDAYGDGLCCTYGNGSYSVVMNGNTVASGGSFGASESTVFVVPPANNFDFAGLSVDMPNLVAAGSNNVSGTVINIGGTAINSLTLNYSINNGAAVSQNVTGLNIAPLAEYSFTHGTPWVSSASGTYTVKVWVSGINGNNDQNTTNDNAQKSIVVASQTVTRTALVEELTSSTCPPCAGLNATFDPLLESNNANVYGSQLAAVKYQMNWPSPGNDPSYNPDGNTRRGYYGTSGIPDVYYNGLPAEGVAQSDIDDIKAVPAPAAMHCYYTISGNTITVDVDVKPFISVASGTKLYIAVNEVEYDYAASSTSQDVYHHAMRKMLPNGSGTNVNNMVDGTNQHFTQSYTFTTAASGVPTPGSYDLWVGMANLEVVAFLQNNATKEIYQAAIGSKVGTSGIADNGKNHSVKVYPNPASDRFILDMNLASTEQVNVELVNSLGQVVFSQNEGTVSGARKLNVDLSNMADGLYFVRVTIGSETRTMKLNIAK